MILTDLSQFAIQRNRKSSKWVRQHNGIDISITGRRVDIRCDNPGCNTQGGKVWQGNLHEFFDKPYHECRSCRAKGVNSARGMIGKDPWNKGLTKSSDPRICEQGQIHSEKIKGENNPWFGKHGSLHPNWGKSINVGKNNPQYKDGKSYERWSARHGLLQRQWAKQVKERDCFTCQSCGCSGSRLVSHHLFDYATHPKKRLDITNGICLCVKCHNLFHLWNGGQVKPCTPDDFSNWLKQR